MANPRAVTAEKPTVLQAPIIPGYSQSSGGGSQSGQTSFAGIEDPEILKSLIATLTQLSSGGTPEMIRQREERNKEIQRTRAISGDYTKGDAFTDAADLMAQNLRQSMEKNMPAISKAIQGAGTSSSSMQGLLSQKLAVESSQAASSLGAKQAVDYGNISANLQQVLEALTRGDNSQIEALLKGFEAARVQRGAQASFTQPTFRSEVGQSGGGSFIAGQEDQGTAAKKSPYEDGVWYGPPTSGDSSYVPVGTPRSYYPNGWEYGE